MVFAEQKGKLKERKKAGEKRMRKVCWERKRRPKATLSWDSMGEQSSSLKHTQVWW